MGKQWKQCQTLFLGAPKSLQMVTAAMKLKDAYYMGSNRFGHDLSDLAEAATPLKKSYDQPR